MSKILVTGGAGFIGSHIVDKLIENGHQVRIFDNLEYQVHQGKIPDYLNKKAEFILGDLRNYEELKRALEDVEIIFHMAAMVGVGQSMYQIKKYTEINVLGTANLLDVLVNEKNCVKKLIVASSMLVYGDGAYECSSCGRVSPLLRSEEQIERKDFEVHCPKCDRILRAIGTNEEEEQKINSIYALTKKAQEDMCLSMGKIHSIPTVALRFFNVYGPRQSLNNPYTGIVAIFMSNLKNNNNPLIFEDGLQTRDFISVHDVAQACILAMENDSANYQVFNVGTGKATSLLELSEVLTKLYGKEIKPNITNKFRKMDIRHCFADISKIKRIIGYEPKITFQEGVKESIEWSFAQEAKDKVDTATKELEEKNLIR